MARLRIKEIAEQKGISQRKLSLGTGIDINTVRRIFSHPETTNPKVGTLEKMADFLQVDITELFASRNDA